MYLMTGARVARSVHAWYFDMHENCKAPLGGLAEVDEDDAVF